MDTVELVGLLVPVTYLVMLAIETWRPAREFPPRRGWTWIGIGFLLLIGAVSTVVPLLIDPRWLTAHRWLDGTPASGLHGHVGDADQPPLDRAQHGFVPT